MSLEDIRNDRIKKVNFIKEKGIDPYPASSKRTITIKELINEFDALEDTQQQLFVAEYLLMHQTH